MYNHNFERVNKREQVDFKGRKGIESLALKQRYLEVTHEKPSKPCRSGKIGINKMMIPNDVTMLEKVVFIGFLSFYAGLVIILWLTDMKLRKLTKGYSGFAKVNVLICYSQTVHGKLLILHLLSIHLYIVTFITFIYS